MNNARYVIHIEPLREGF